MGRILEFGHFRLSERTLRLEDVNGGHIALHLQTRKVLLALAQHRVLAGDDPMGIPALRQAAWPGVTIADNTVHSHISELKAAIKERDPDTDYISKGQRGEGYVFLVGVRPVAEAESLARSQRAATLTGQDGKVPDDVLEIPRRRWDAGRLPPGALLRADCAAVPFHGRDSEMRDLEGWCESGAALGIRLYTGAGGMGKTRLLLEVCERLKKRGWRAGFLRSQPVVATTDWVSNVLGAPRLCLVVDYAETRRGDLVSLLSAWVPESPSRIRLVLLARQAGGWWDGMMREGAGVGELLMGPATQRNSLQPLTMFSSDRQASFETAVNAFAQALGQPARSSLPLDLEADYYTRVLLLQMSALASVNGVEVQGDQGILHWVLERERRYWSTQIKAAGLPEFLDTAVAQAMTVITLIGGTEDRRHTNQVLKKVPLLRDQSEVIRRAIATILHNAYPGNNCVEPILPDLLGEHLIQEELYKEETLVKIAFESSPDPSN